MSICLSFCPHAYLRNHTTKLRQSFCACYLYGRDDFTSGFAEDVVLFYSGPYDGVTLPQQPRCSVVHRLTPLLRGISCVGGGARQDQTSPACIGLSMRRCRHPMPDYYSVMLEVAKDRATAAAVRTCSTEDFEAGRCPDAVSAGDRYLHRAVNEPCRKMVSN